METQGAQVLGKYQTSGERFSETEVKGSSSPPSLCPPKDLNQSIKT